MYVVLQALDCEARQQPLTLAGLKSMEEDRKRKENPRGLAGHGSPLRTAEL